MRELESNLASLVQLWNKYEKLLFGKTRIERRRRNDDSSGRFLADSGGSNRDWRRDAITKHAVES
ncbi:hypothetical protein CsSME_00011030 [Camellia sinensis var. sinensis]